MLKTPDGKLLTKSLFKDIEDSTIVAVPKFAKFKIEDWMFINTLPRYVEYVLFGRKF